MKLRVSLLLLMILVSASLVGQTEQSKSFNTNDLEPRLESWILTSKNDGTHLTIGSSLNKKLESGKYEAVKTVVHEVILEKGMVTSGDESRQTNPYLAELANRNINPLIRFAGDSLAWFTELGDKGNYNIHFLSVHSGSKLKIFGSAYPEGEKQTEPAFYELDLYRGKMTVANKTRDFDQVEGEIVFGNVHAISTYAINMLREWYKPPVSNLAE